MQKKLGQKMNKEKKSEVKEESKKELDKQLAVVRIRGNINLRKEIVDTLNMLRLYKRNHCVVIPNNNSYSGMIQKVKDYVTWGEINDEVLNLLVEKLQEENKKTFRLQPPKGGFEKKGTKVDYKSGGALGYRKEKINDLIKRMV